MPKLLSETEVRLDWADIEGRVLKKRGNTKRSPGVHLSGIIKYVAKTSGILKSEDEADEMPLRMAVGMAWEEWAVGLWPIHWQPKECTRDGVVGSPDGTSLCISEGGSYKSRMVEGIKLDEFKATWKSRHNYSDILAPNNRLWIWQMAGYLAMMGLTHARLHVIWINGSYRPPNPEYRTYLLEYTTEELEEFWRNVVLPNREFAVAEVER